VFYCDFFEPPPGASLSRTKTAPKRSHDPDSSGQVRFHDEVKVLKIKARGKNLPVLDMEDEGSVDDDDNYDDNYDDDNDGSDDDDDDAFVKPGNCLQESIWQYTDISSGRNH
jgi:U3 small nucleolar RNA-associated protein MPP10